jgi:CheY-like chemotaxis protein
MARVLALSADLLFGSQLQGALTAAGYEVELIGAAERLRERLAEPGRPSADVLLVDLTDADLDGVAVVAALREDGRLAATRTLGFYAHVEPAVRERAQRAGFDLVVPRSRFAREGPSLVAALLAP